MENLKSKIREIIKSHCDGTIASNNPRKWDFTGDVNILIEEINEAIDDLNSEDDEN